MGANASRFCVRFDPDLTSWRAAAVGDSCLFHLRDGQLLCSYPVQRASDFGTSPELVCSRAHSGDKVGGERKAAKGSWQAGDCLLLATDALAEWCLREVENGRVPWTQLVNFRSKEAFAAWSTCLGAARELRNDDLTLLSIAARS